MTTKRYFENRREMRRRKKQMRAYICMGIMCAACVFSFWLGTCAAGSGRAEKEETEAVVMEEVDMSVEIEGVAEQENEQEELQDSGSDIREEDAASRGNHSSGKSEKESGSNGEKTKNEEGQPEIDKSGIILVNKQNKLPEDYKVVLKKLPDRTNQAAEAAYQPMCDMIAAARKEGLALEVCSSYRSVKRQKELFEEDMHALVRQGYSYLDAYDEVARETMPPGYSEHSTGLAFDIVSLGYQMLDEKQEDTAENQWLREHCAEFGFILRYPKEKEEITGVSYESWHFRYVGVEAAEYIMENDLTLEEFLEEG